jgi:hypothetical protein
MKKILLLITGLFMLSGCNSKIDYTKENLSNDNDLKFIGQNSEYMSGYHDYDNNIIGFDLKLLVSNDVYFKAILDKANLDDWKIVHNDSSALILYKIIDNSPTTIKFSKANQFVSVKIE